MKAIKVLSLLLAAAMLFALTACFNVKIVFPETASRGRPPDRPERTVFERAAYRRYAALVRAHAARYHRAPALRERSADGAHNRGEKNARSDE